MDNQQPKTIAVRLTLEQIRLLQEVVTQRLNHINSQHLITTGVISLRSAWQKIDDILREHLKYG
jgi:hypothetical protein